MKPVKEALLEYAEHQNPRAHLILEAVTIESEDIKDTRTDWNAADSVTGWTRLHNGGAKPSGSEADKIAYSTGTADVVTSLGGITAASIGVVAVRWSPSTADEVFQDINGFTARLDPDADGGGKEVTHYVGQMFRLAREDVGDWTLEAITVPSRVLAPVSTSDVLFPVTGVSTRIGDAPEGDSQPTTVLVVAAYKGDGAVASNVAWLGNTSITTTTVGNNRVTGYTLVEINDESGSQTVHVKAITTGAGIPRFAIKGQTYTQQTIEFTGSNAPTLANTPTGTVEFVLEDEEPGGSSGAGYVRNNGSTTWVAFTDGQTVTDLTGVSSTGPQYEMRYIASPSTSGFTIPTIRRLGVRELTRETVDGIARIGNPIYQLDPFSLKAGIPVLSFELTRDGVQDYRDYATELFSDNHVGQMEFRVHYGHEDLDRKDWLLLDQFRLHDYESGGEAIVVDAIHPLALLKQTIPKGSTAGQDPVVIAGTTDTVEDAYLNILNTVGLPDRYKGVLVSSTATTKVAKTLSEPRPAKEEAERLAFIEGGAVIPSGGRLKWQRIWSTTGGLVNAPVAHFDNIAPVSVSPNLDRRIVTYRVPYGWSQKLNEGRGGFEGAIFQSSSSALSKLGHATLEPVQDLDAETSKWLLNDSTTGSIYAQAIAGRTVAAFKQGAVAISFQAEHPQPWLELGDTVEVSTDRLVGRGVETDRALRGRLSVTGPIIEHDLRGEAFTVWVPELDAAVPLPTNIPIDYGTPEIAIVEQRQRSLVPSGGNQRFERDFLLQPSVSCKSYGVVYSFARINDPPGSPTFISGNYYVDTTTPGVVESHTIGESSTGGSAQTFIIRNSTALGPVADAAVSVTVTPYSKIGGSTGGGVAGLAQPILTDKLGDSDYVGVRAQVSGASTGWVTDTVSGYRLVAGTGISIAFSTAGEIVISST